jgi:hypothetical protein
VLAEQAREAVAAQARSHSGVRPVHWERALAIGRPDVVMDEILHLVAASEARSKRRSAMRRNDRSLWAPHIGRLTRSLTRLQLQNPRHKILVTECDPFRSLKHSPQLSSGRNSGHRVARQEVPHSLHWPISTIHAELWSARSPSLDRLPTPPVVQSGCHTTPTIRDRIAPSLRSTS